MPDDLTPEEKAEAVYQTILKNMLLLDLLSWTLAEAVHMTQQVEELTGSEVAMLYEKLAERARTSAIGHR